MSILTPADEDWYARQSAKRSLPRHCPLAANEKCPRYFLSQKCAAATGAIGLDLSHEVLARLEAQWEVSDVFASMELSVGTWLAQGGTLRGVDGFCPEVTARIFHLYCSSLRTYPDEDARIAYHKLLAVEKIAKEDPRWNWMVVEPRHFTECHEFSVYRTDCISRSAKSKARKGTLSPKLRFQVFSRDGYRCIYCGATGAEAALHIDHKVSVAEGGTDEIENLATACDRCNLGKGAQSGIDS